MRSTETYTETNFLRLETADVEDTVSLCVTLEHFSCAAAEPGDSTESGWSCQTIVDEEKMSRKDAVFIAKSYAAEHDVPVIYDCHSE